MRDINRDILPILKKLKSSLASSFEYITKLELYNYKIIPNDTKEVINRVKEILNKLSKSLEDWIKDRPNMEKCLVPESLENIPKYDNNKELGPPEEWCNSLERDFHGEDISLLQPIVKYSSNLQPIVKYSSNLQTLIPTLLGNGKLDSNIKEKLCSYLKEVISLTLSLEEVKKEQDSKLKNIKPQTEILKPEERIRFEKQMQEERIRFEKQMQEERIRFEKQMQEERIRFEKQMQEERIRFLEKKLQAFPSGGEEIPIEEVEDVEEEGEDVITSTSEGRDNSSQKSQSSAFPKGENASKTSHPQATKIKQPSSKKNKEWIKSVPSSAYQDDLKSHRIIPTIHRNKDKKFDEPEGKVGRINRI